MGNQNKTEPRLSLQGIRVLQLFVSNGASELSGVDVRKSIGLASGTLYPILMRFEQAGWLKSRWEDIDPSEAGRPRKRLYKITAAGQRKESELLMPSFGSVQIA